MLRRAVQQCSKQVDEKSFLAMENLVFIGHSNGIEQSKTNRSILC